MRHLKKFIYPMLAVLVLSGCGVSSGKKPESGPSLLVSAWEKACETDYKSSACEIGARKAVGEVRSGSGDAYASILPFIDAAKSTECLKSSKSDSCQALSIFYANQMTDVKCEKVSAFGSGFFCTVSLYVRNTSSSPIDDYFSGSLYDSKGNEFAADVEGSFQSGLSSFEFSKEVKIHLNPEQTKNVNFSFSIPDIDRSYREIVLHTSFNTNISSSIPLCKKNSGDLLDIAKDYQSKIVIYEDARLLNSCKFDVTNQVFVNRLDGSIS